MLVYLMEGLMLELSPAQKRDLLEAYNRHKNGYKYGGGLQTGHFLYAKGLVQRTLSLGYKSVRQWYVITDKGIKLAAAID
jgi:hypothetical protein